MATGLEGTLGGQCSTCEEVGHIPPLQKNDTMSLDIEVLFSNLIVKSEL